MDRFYPVLYPKVGISKRKLSLAINQHDTSISWSWILAALSSSGIKAHCHLWWACDQQQLQVWGYLSNVWPGEWASEIPLLIFAFVVCVTPPENVLFFRQQKRSCLGIWKKVPPLWSSWSFWATRLNFMTLKGLDTFKINFSECFSAADVNDVA